MHIGGAETNTLQIDFPPRLLSAKAAVGLFEVNGRLASRLFEGRISSPVLRLHIHHANLRPGIYVVQVSATGNTLAVTEYPIVR